MLRVWAVLLAASVLSTAAQARSSRCGAGVISLERVRFGTAGSFHEYLDLALRNTGHRRCVIAGYPTLVLLDANGHALHGRVSDDMSVIPTRVTLGPRQRASFTLHYIGSGPCAHAVHAAAIRIVPPGIAERLVLRQQLDLCAPADLQVEPLRLTLSDTPRIPAASGGAPRYANFTRKAVRIIYSGDGSALLAGPDEISRHLRWTTWTATQGRASGADWHDDCIPDCARGTYTAYPASVHVYRPRVLGGYLLFTRMTVAYLGASPPYPAFRPASVTYRLDFQASYNSFFWAAS